MWKELVLSSVRTVTRPLIGSGIGCYAPINNVYKYLCKLYISNNIVNVRDFKMLVQSCDSMPGLLIGHKYEQFNVFVLENIVKIGMNVIDIGANNGYFTLVLSKLVGNDGVVIAFEPAYANYMHLERNILINGFKNILVSNMAVSNTTSDSVLYYSGYRGATYTQYRNSYKDKSNIIKTVTLDAYLSDKQFKVDVIKIDIDGYEMYALEGMKNTIANSSDIKMLIEYSPPHLNKSGYKSIDLWGMLHNLGFTYIYLLDEKKEQLILCNYDDVVKYSIDNIFKRDTGATLLCTKNVLCGVWA